jgi:hypothetical protein
MNPQQTLELAARRGDPLHFKPWEENPGVIEMRKILRETKPNTSLRMQRAQRAMVFIKALWEQMSGSIQGLAIPKAMKQTMNTMFERLRTDRQYAINAYNVFPVLADRYGAGLQISGKPRLSFVRMIDDPLARQLL